jgi:hypothetical protein
MIYSWQVLGVVSSAILIALTWLWMRDPPPTWVIMMFVAASPFVFYAALMAGADPRFIGIAGLTYAGASIVLLERSRRK